MRAIKLKQVLAQDRRAFNGIDPVEAILFLTAKYTLLPELFDIFGKEKAVEFLTRFSGKTLKIPSREAIEEALTQLNIWSAMNKDSSPESMKRLSLRYGMKEGELRAAFSKVQGMMHEQQERFTTKVEEGKSVEPVSYTGDGKLSNGEYLFGTGPSTGSDAV